MDKGTQCIEYQSEREVRRGSEKGDQETPTAARPNQNVDRFSRNQRQISSHGQTKADRDGKISVRTILKFLIIWSKTPLIMCFCPLI